nr:MAG TPA: hypothetical protein [Caudoviricetes sp.]DAZ61931.1 MAG TPA: hypothetical protein [Caudoviricetes sp.]
MDSSSPKRKHSKFLIGSFDAIYILGLILSL